MKTTTIHCILTALFAILGLVSCSDNYDAGLIPVLGKRSLSVDGHDTAFTLNFNASPSINEVKVESNTLWKVEVVCDGGWCSVDKVSGRGNESFSINLRDNMIEKRTCSVSVYMIDAQGEKLVGVPGSSITVTVTQDVSAVRLSPSSIEPFKPQGNERQLFHIIANVAWTLSVDYDGDNASGFINIVPEEGDMAASDNGRFTGEGEASFYLSVTDNRTAADRRAYLNLRSDAGSYSVEISQAKSEFSFDVSPLENQVIAAEGGTIRFGVLSLVGWDVRSAADWITFSLSSSAQGSDSRVETVATVAPNTTGSERSAEIRFIPRDSRYQELSLSVSQRCYDMTFGISCPDASDIIMENGGTLVFDLDSRFDWIIETPSWVSADIHEGTASASPRVITLDVSKNSTNNTRTGTVSIYPQPTEIAGDVKLDPHILGIEPLRLQVTQFGGREAAISVPWLADGYTQTSATVEFNYYSPFADIVEAGLQWRKEDASEWNTEMVSVSDSTEGTVSIELKSLEPATKYVARGYVKDADGIVKYGTVSYPFTTGGQFPGSWDNPTPSR